jgi:hypothetical protein
MAKVVAESSLSSTIRMRRRTEGLTGVSSLPWLFRHKGKDHGQSNDESLPMLRLSLRTSTVPLHNQPLHDVQANA